MSGLSAIAFSSRRLPMKHQGQTTSETMSIGRAEVIARSSLKEGETYLVLPLLGGNPGIGADARHQRGEIVTRPQRGERDHWPDGAAVAARREHRPPQRASDAA